MVRVIAATLMFAVVAAGMVIGTVALIVSDPAFIPVWLSGVVATFAVLRWMVRAMPVDAPNVSTCMVLSWMWPLTAAVLGGALVVEYVRSWKVDRRVARARRQDAWARPYVTWSIGRDENRRGWPRWWHP